MNQEKYIGGSDYSYPRNLYSHRPGIGIHTPRKYAYTRRVRTRQECRSIAIPCEDLSLATSGAIRGW
jgi:hypothetical protein